MKNKSTELDVDFIGGQGSLTKDEEKQISEFIKAQKLLKAKRQIHKTKTSQRKKSFA
jgi:hypothetical protein